MFGQLGIEIPDPVAQIVSMGSLEYTGTTDLPKLWNGHMYQILALMPASTTGDSYSAVVAAEDGKPYTVVMPDGDWNLMGLSPIVQQN